MKQRGILDKIQAEKSMAAVQGWQRLIRHASTYEQCLIASCLF